MPVISKFYNLDPDITLGGDTASDITIPSQKAIKSYVDNSIPTVNNATLTIKQNSTSKGTFTANASSNVEINLTDTTYSAFSGADGSDAGTSGLVPAPTATDNTKFLKGDGTWATVSASLPSQTGNSGKFLTTDGTDPSWVNISQLPSQTDQNGKYLTTNGTTASWTTLTIPTTTDSVTSGSTAALTSGGAYTNLITSVTAHSTDANKINVTKAGSTTTITINDVAHATSADSATTAGSASSVAWSAISDVPSSFTPSAHTHTTADIIALTGYEIASSASAITTTDTLNQALGKLQKSIDGKQASGSYVLTSRTINSKALSSDITLTASDVGALPDSTIIPTVDQSYSSSSTNAQSGTAVASAISGKADSATSLAGYGITDAYTKTEIDGKLSGAMHFKGTKASVSNLPTTGNVQGDMWNVTDTGANYAWDGSAWDKLSENIDLSGYVPTSRTINSKALTGNISLTASDVGAAATSHSHTTADVTLLTGYEIASAAASIATTDTLNQALGKLQKSIDGKQASGSYVPTTRTVNGKALSADITLSASDVNALPSSTVILARYSVDNPSLTKDSSNNCTWTATNSTGSALAMVQLMEKSTGKIILADITVTASTITVVFNYGANIAANTYTLVMIG